MEKPSCVIILMSPLAGRQAKRRRIPHTLDYEQGGIPHPLKRVRNDYQTDFFPIL
jgi:hypothetical protein